MPNIDGGGETVRLYLFSLVLAIYTYVGLYVLSEIWRHIQSLREPSQDQDIETGLFRGHFLEDIIHHAAVENNPLGPDVTIKTEELQPLLDLLKPLNYNLVMA